MSMKSVVFMILLHALNLEQFGDFILDEEDPGVSPTLLKTCFVED